jgi:RNA polymerase sigma-70 factor (ECF subfamily)
MDEDRKLIEQAKNNPDTFGLLFDKYYSRIFRYIQRRTADISVTQDLASDVFCKALEEIDHFTWRGVPFSAWLYRIASRKIADFYTKESRWNRTFIRFSDSDFDNSVVLNKELSNAQDMMQRYEQFLDLYVAISQLPFKYQEVITLRYFEGMQFNEIALILKKPEGTVKTLVNRALMRLKVIMTNESKPLKAKSALKEVRK